MPSVRPQIQQLVAEIRGETHHDEPNVARLHHIAREAADVLACFVDAFDDDNKAADQAQLEKDLRELAEAFIDNANLGIGMRRIAIGALPWVLAPLVEQADDYSGEGVQWLANVLAPQLEDIEKTVAAFRGAALGNPPE